MRVRERAVVVTGAGVVCHLGDDCGKIEALVRQGRTLPLSHWQPPTPYDARCMLVGLYRGELCGERHQTRFMGRAARLAYHAAARAVAAARLDGHEAAVIVGSGTGDIDTIVETWARLEHGHSARRVSPTAIPRMMASTVSANLAAALGTVGPCFSVSAACAGGAINIALAAELIEQGHVDVAIAGGAEAADSLFHAGFDAMRAYCNAEATAERALCPYAADRTGFVFGEGAGIVVLEARAHAEARGARPLGTIRGFGLSCNGTADMVASSADGTLAAMRRALDHAELAPEAIDYVNTHGTGTRQGDVVEIEALRRLFGGRRVAYSSTKGYTGHTVSAAGAIELILTLAMLRDGWIAPSLYAEPLDPAFADDPPVRRPQAAPLALALSNSLGFGGTNACLVLGRA
jgi:3-oxoacyl-[acyl-carrier-protein] synthase-1